MTVDVTRPTPAVLAEDLRALADVVPFDQATTAVLEAAADYLDEIGRGVAHKPAGFVDLDATYQTGTPASDRLVAASRRIMARPVVCGHVATRETDTAIAHYRCDLPADHGGVHQQSGGPAWNDAGELL